MKFQIDTKAKTIKIEEEVKLSELFEMLEKILPNGEWKKYKLESNVIVNWTNPTVIEKHIHHDRWQHPFVPFRTYPNPSWMITCDNTDTETYPQVISHTNDPSMVLIGDTKVQAGGMPSTQTVYNVEVIH